MSIINGMNACADAIGYGVSKVGVTLIPGALGAMGSRLIVGDWRIGALQGLVSGVFFAWTISPLSDFVDKNKGDGINQVHANTRNVLWVAGLILQYAVPAILAVYAGNAILSACGRYIPMLAPKLAERSYTVLTALAVNIAPAIAQHSIKCLRDEMQKK